MAHEVSQFLLGYPLFLQRIVRVVLKLSCAAAPEPKLRYVPLLPYLFGRQKRSSLMEF
jgi:hypothetical protein